MPIFRMDGPLKVRGDSAGNIREPVESRPGVIFRWPGGKIELREGARPSDVAAWTLVGDGRRTEGDFSIPALEESRPKAFERYCPMADGYLENEKARLERENIPEKKFQPRLRETWLRNPKAELP